MTAPEVTDLDMTALEIMFLADGAMASPIADAPTFGAGCRYEENLK